MKLQSER